MKTALVTGTKLGVGNALVTELSKRGYRVVATSRDPNYLIQNKEKNGWGEEVLIEQLDLSDIDSIENLYNKYKDIDLDLLVNNAAGGSYYESSPEGLFKTFEYASLLNVVGPAHLTKLFLNNLKRSQNPTVVMISSFAGKYFYAGDITYSVSKSAVSAMAEVLRIEFMHSNVKVTEIRPASINTRPDNPNINHMDTSNVVDAIMWVSEVPKNCNIDLVEMSPIFCKKYS